MSFRYVAYPAIFARPGYGSLAPLVLGVTLAGVVSTGGQHCQLLLCLAHNDCFVHPYSLGSLLQPLTEPCLFCAEPCHAAVQPCSRPLHRLQPAEPCAEQTLLFLLFSDYTLSVPCCIAVLLNPAAGPFTGYSLLNPSLSSALL